MSSCLKKTDVMTSATCSHRFCDAFVSLRGSLGRPVWCSFPPAGDGKVEVANVGILGSGCASGCETSVPGMMEQGWKRDGSEAIPFLPFAMSRTRFSGALPGVGQAVVQEGLPVFSHVPARCASPLPWHRTKTQVQPCFSSGHASHLGLFLLWLRNKFC